MLLVQTLALIALAIASLLPIGPGRIADPSASQATLHAQIDLIQDRVTVVRELKPLSPIERSLMSRQGLRAYLVDAFLEEVTPEEIEANTLRWEVLGYIPPGTDLVQIYIEVLTEQVLGFYALDRKVLFLISEQESLTASDELTLAHEVTHALQDQHYDLKGMFDRAGNENDLVMAIQALAEGDAVLTSLLYGREFMTTAQLLEAFQSDMAVGSSVLDSAPLVVRRELLFPYTSGIDFLAEWYTQGRWEAVDRVWRNPPQSTEQILHPEKYQAGDAPIPVTAPDLAPVLGPEWRQLEENTNGELDWNILIEQYVDAATANEAAAGWGGDRFRLLRRDSDGALVFAARTAWDTELDAQQFYRAMQRVATGRHGAELRVSPLPAAGASAEVGQQIPDRWSAQAAPYSYALELEGTWVTLVISTGPPAGEIAAAMRTP